MIGLDYQGILGKTIGNAEGIPENDFKTLCHKAQFFLKTVLKSEKETGYAFLQLPEEKALVQKINGFVKTQQKKRWGTIVVLGIGGSALGLSAIKEALLGPWHDLNKTPRLFVLDNIDPAVIAELFSFLNLKKTLCIVISKSGTTVEPMALYAIFKEKFKKSFPKNYAEHFVFITDPKKGSLREIAEREGIINFSVPSKVGGRFSVLSSVGLVPAALVGLPVADLLKGAKRMKTLIQKKQNDNPAVILATAQYFLDQKRQKPMTVMMTYGQQLFKVSDWYRQLLAESIGKKTDAGPTPMTALGATDQHSQLQLWKEGPNNKFFIFLKIKKYPLDPRVPASVPAELSFLEKKSLGTILSAALEGTRQSLTRDHRPNLTLELPALTAEILGGLFMLLECQVALLGKLYKVNAFDQPGVEESKRITKDLLADK